MIFRSVLVTFAVLVVLRLLGLDAVGWVDTAVTGAVNWLRALG